VFGAAALLGLAAEQRIGAVLGVIGGHPGGGRLLGGMGRRRLVFAGKTLRVLSGSKATGEVDLARVTRLVLRRRLVGRVYRVTYLAVLPEREAELFDTVNYPEVPRVVQLLGERTAELRKNAPELTFGVAFRTRTAHSYVIYFR